MLHHTVALLDEDGIHEDDVPDAHEGDDDDTDGAFRVPSIWNDVVEGDVPLALLDDDASDEEDASIGEHLADEDDDSLEMKELSLFAEPPAMAARGRFQESDH
jgi:hypothetical protein